MSGVRLDSLLSEDAREGALLQCFVSGTALDECARSATRHLPGLPPGVVAELCGPPGGGKTSTCVAMAAEAIAQNFIGPPTHAPAAHVVWIATGPASAPAGMLLQAVASRCAGRGVAGPEGPHDLDPFLTIVGAVGGAHALTHVLTELGAPSALQFASASGALPLRMLLVVDGLAAVLAGLEAEVRGEGPLAPGTAPLDGHARTSAVHELRRALRNVVNTWMWGHRVACSAVITNATTRGPPAPHASPTARNWARLPSTPRPYGGSVWRACADMTFFVTLTEESRDSEAASKEGLAGPRLSIAHI